ncbi:uncharacterized protein LOC124860074 [Girardinichthys multiradiatus]|uniref:uncharacterized protein LOC124860074 n=1 Tax=Girardinichthys multiradiatus TaxID=208333 RepID=UPI001FAC8143|nr:uncharacterized protein LOC124860074 [Girardinichthys multiradiatus]
MSFLFGQRTSASARYFQAFLVDGVVRWNEDRAAAPAGAAETSLHSYSGHLKHAFNQKSQRVLGLQMVEDFTKPAAYTGELIGLEYLFRQTSSVFEDINLDPDLDPFPRLRMRRYNRMRRTPPSSHQIPPLPLWQLPSQEEIQGPDGQPGYQHVLKPIKALVESEHPTFRWAPNGTLILKASREAQGVGPQKGAYRAKPTEEVEADTRAHVIREGGDVSNAALILSRCALQFGRYLGRTFLWLLENDVGYAVNLVASHQKERKRTGSQSPLMANKDALLRYSSAYPDFLEAVRFHRAFEEPGQEGQALVGFGDFKYETLQSLYESVDPKKIRFVNYLRRTSPAPGSQMEKAVGYVRRRDRQRTGATAAAAASAATTTSTATSSTSSGGGVCLSAEACFQDCITFCSLRFHTAFSVWVGDAGRLEEAELLN